VVDHSDDPTEQIERISAEGGSRTATIGRHRMPSAGADAVVTTDPLSGRTPTRKLAPLAVGASVALVATMVAAVLQQPAEEASLAEPELSAIVQGAPTTTSVPAPTPSAIPAPPPATAPPPPAAERPAATAEPKAEEGEEGPAAPASSGDGTQAAAIHGWTLAGGDEFNGGRSSTWGDYNGPGHAGNGRRTSDAISVENGMLVIRGDSKGTTGGTAWKQAQRFGRWEMRAKFPSGDPQYHPVLILWPTDVPWPKGGEVDFAETTSASDGVSFFLHYGSSNSQKSAKKTIDITQWHNYAVEWVNGRVTGYLDGEKWFESTDAGTIPPGKMQATIQLDYFPKGGSPKPTEMYVDFMRMYR
jgi:hypothetical protein